MPFFKALTALSSSGPVASRAFMPLFIVSLLASERAHVIIRKIGIFADDLCIMLPENMAWIGSDGFLITVGILAVLEAMADKNDDIKELMEQVHVVVKTGVSLLVALAILPQGTAETLTPGTPAVQEAGMGHLMGWNGIVLVGTGVMTYFLAKFRAKFFGHWFEVDDEDDFNIRKVISFMEDIWAIIALPFFLVFPLLAIVIILGLFLIVIMSKKLTNWLEDRRRYACVACKHDILPTASACPSCKTDITPKEILSWNILFGRRYPHTEGELDKDVVDRHRLRLLSRRRCPNCAERIDPPKFLKDGCNQCGFTFKSVNYDDWYDDYRTEVIGRGLRLVLPLMLVSWIPAVGIALAVVSVKVFVSAPLRLFLGGFSRFGLKWGMRLFTILLVFVGSLPFVSMLAVPILLLVHIWVYSTFAKKRITDSDIDESAGERDDISNVQQV